MKEHNLATARMPSAPKPLRRLASVTTLLPPGTTPDGSRGQILSEALRLFAEQGYGAASVRDIAQLVGIKNPTLYSHYPSKAHILAELIRIGHEEHHRRLTDALRIAPKDPQSQLLALVRANVCTHAQYAMLAVVANTELHALPTEFSEPIVALRGRSEALLRDIIQKGVESGLFHVPDLRLAMKAISAMGSRVARWYTPADSQTPEEISDIYGQYACRILGVMN